MNITIKFFIFELSTKLRLKVTILICWKKFAQKSISVGKREKINFFIEFYILKLVQESKFDLKMTIDLWAEFARKGYFRSRTEKANKAIEFCIFELPGQNVWNKMEKSSKSGQEKKFSIYFCVFFSCQGLMFWRGTGHQAMCPAKSEIFLIFPNFLRS